MGVQTEVKTASLNNCKLIIANWRSHRHHTFSPTIPCMASRELVQWETELRRSFWQRAKNDTCASKLRDQLYTPADFLREFTIKSDFIPLFVKPSRQLAVVSHKFTIRQLNINLSMSNISLRPKIICNRARRSAFCAAPYTQFGSLCGFTLFDGIQEKVMLSRLMVNLHESDTIMHKMAYVFLA